MKTISNKYPPSHSVRLTNYRYAHQQSAKTTKSIFFILASAVALSILVNIQQPVAAFISSNFNNSNNSSRSDGSNDSRMIAVSPAVIDSASKPATDYAHFRVDETSLVTMESENEKAAMEKATLKHAAELKAGEAFLKMNDLKNMAVMAELPHVTELHEFHFRKEVFQINEAGVEKLDSILQKYLTVPESYSEIIVLGFTDNRGTKLNNVKLGFKRAASLKSLLIKKGIPAEKIKLASFGSELPIGSNETGEGRLRNRRVELNVLGTTGT